MFNCTVTVQSPKIGKVKCVPVYQDTWVMCGENFAIHFLAKDFNFTLQKMVKGEFDGMYI